MESTTERAGASTPTEAAGGPNVAGSVGDDLLLVPRAYLQGQWCDSDGQSWTIDGDTARIEDTSGGVAVLPIDLAFIDNLDVDLISQTDNEFVIGSMGNQTTFTRGSCLGGPRLGRCCQRATARSPAGVSGAAAQAVRESEDTGSGRRR